MTDRQISHKQNKAAIRTFLRQGYTDERLVMLLAHAQSGRLVYQSCCCLIGVSTADHPLRGKMTIDEIDDTPHYNSKDLDSPAALLAERSYAALAPINSERRRILIPIVSAEIRRRDRAKQAGDIARSLMAEMECM